MDHTLNSSCSTTFSHEIICLQLKLDNKKHYKKNQIKLKFYYLNLQSLLTEESYVRSHAY